jgi:diguanylate cyclase (GGDEF)-like protein
VKHKTSVSAWQGLPAGLVGVPVAVALTAMVLSRVIGQGSPVWWDIAWTASSFSALAGMLLARRAAAQLDRRRWSLWTAAAGSWLTGQMFWNVYGVIGFPTSPNLADVCWWGFAGLVMMSLVRSRASSRSVRRVATFETLSVIAGAIALTVGELWHDAAVSTLALAPRISALAYPAVYIAATVLMLQAMVTGSSRAFRSGALRLVLAGMAAQALGFGLWSEQLLARTYVPGKTPLDPLWVLGLAMIGVGGLLAAHRPPPGVASDEPAQQGGILPAALFVLLIAALVQAQLAGAPVGARISLGAGLLFSGATLIVRGALLERRLLEMLNRERSALASLAEREAELGLLNVQLVEDSRRDPLTGMHNRRALADDLLALDAARNEHGGSYALALCDVDHFKAYNDRLGHLAGDQALREISAIVRGALRRGDVAYRFGGEELLLLLQDVTPVQAVEAVERVRHAVIGAAMPHPEAAGCIMTVSIGVAAGGEDANAALARADGALYDAKRAGRNRTVAAGDHSAGSPPGAGGHHAALHEPVPRHVRSMLAVSRAAASGRGAMPVLEALAETIRSELAFHVVSVNVLDGERAELRCVIVLGDEDARRTLLGKRAPWPEWETVMTPEHERSGAIWLPAGAHAWEDESVFWVPPAAAAPGPDSWDPDDMLVLPLRGQDGDVLGIVSVDQPVSGRRPDDSQIAYLMAVADHAGLALEQSRRDSEQAAAAQEQSAELRLAAVMLLAETLDLRDPSTARHSRTVGAYAERTALALGLPAGRVERIRAAGVVHDLGKLGIADAILHKPGPLNDAEWQEMMSHPEIGARILEHAGLHQIAGWVRAHHERIDGHGYPDRLGPDEIALESRILAVADAYEAMIADRPYRAGMPPAAARRELERCAGSQFDPAVVQALISTLDAVPGGSTGIAGVDRGGAEPDATDPAPHAPGAAVLGSAV